MFIFINSLSLILVEFKVVVFFRCFRWLTYYLCFNKA